MRVGTNAETVSNRVLELESSTANSATLTGIADHARQFERGVVGFTVAMTTRATIALVSPGWQSADLGCVYANDERCGKGSNEFHKFLRKVFVILFYS